MRVAGTLVFALSVLVDSIVCSSGGGKVSTAYIPPSDSVFRMTLYKHHNVFYKGEDNEIHPLLGPVNFLQKGYDIVGYGDDYKPVRPMRDSEGKVFIEKNGRRMEIDEKKIAQYGIVGNMPPLPLQPIQEIKEEKKNFWSSWPFGN